MKKKDRDSKVSDLRKRIRRMRRKHGEEYMDKTAPESRDISLLGVRSLEEIIEKVENETTGYYRPKSSRKIYKVTAWTRRLTGRYSYHVTPWSLLLRRRRYDEMGWSAESINPEWDLVSGKEVRR